MGGGGTPVFIIFMGLACSTPLLPSRGSPRNETSTVRLLASLLLRLGGEKKNGTQCCCSARTTRNQESLQPRRIVQKYQSHVDLSRNRQLSGKNEAAKQSTPKYKTQTTCILSPQPLEKHPGFFFRFYFFLLDLFPNPPDDSLQTEKKLL